MVDFCRLSGIRRHYVPHGQRLAVVDGVALNLKKGEQVAITGPSGAGKSTLLAILGLIDVDFEGSYRFLGHDVHAATAQQRETWRLNKIGFAFQNLHLVPSLTAEENVALPAMAAGAAEAAARDRAAELLTACGLSARRGHRPSQLSGGEARRVACARALVNRPELLLVDEPTAELDAKSRAGVSSLLQRAAEEGAALVAVTHDAQLLTHFPRRIEMDRGQIVSDSKK